MPTDDQTEAEALDDDRLVDDYPPDRPLGVDQYGTTPQEERIGEPIEERVRREQPDDERLADEAGGDEPDVGPVGTETPTDRVAAPAEEAAMHETGGPA